MTTDKLPKILQDSIRENSVDIEVITKYLKLPWLKLDIKFDTPTQQDLEETFSNTDWRQKWQFPDHENQAYQVKGWNGNIFFGPTNFEKFLKLSASYNSTHDHDEDSRCRQLRKQIPYDWCVDDSSYIKKQVKKLLPSDEDINLVNSYNLPPGGYVFPHRDYALDGLGLAKIYVALKWSSGNVFGMYGCGNLPIHEGDVFLINNYTLPHWVYNGSKEHRIVIDISANLKSPLIAQKIADAFTKTFEVDLES